MSAEIVVMNKGAIALAADSAVTIGNGSRIYNTSNKLFMLSKYHPIGIMIYNNADFMGVPWEVIIKIYRKRLGDVKFDTIKEYCQHFIEFLNNEDLQLHTCEEEYVKDITLNYLFMLKDEIINTIKLKINEVERELTDEEQIEISSNIINRHHESLNTYENIVNITADTVDYIIRHYNQKTEDWVKQIIGSFLISNKDFGKILTMPAQLFIKNFFGNMYSGIVIAGFGEKEIFPALISFKIQGIINKKVKYVLDNEKNISLESNFAIIPFAQTDVVNTFIRGFDTNYIDVIKRVFDEQILGSIENGGSCSLTSDQCRTLIEELEGKFKNFINEIFDYSSKNFVYPFLRSIQFLPKDELASMAESLVNLTSFKRQVAMDNYERTVGGPIDVAVISKGDGFVWINRKHYFKAELNHHFFDNYYALREERDSNE